VARADAAGQPIDLCLIDWRLPGMDGIECARRLQTLPLTRRPAQLMITAFGSQLPDALLQGSGVRQVLDKPIALQTLRQALADVLADTLAPGRPPAPAPRPTRPSYEALLRQRSHCRLLLVEDNPLNQEVALQLLQDVGLHADLANDGLQALDRLQARTYDLVLMDVQMPHLDGLGATRALRLQPALAGLPVLAMTAGAMTEDREQCLASGMNDVVTKPVDPADLYAALLRWLPAPPAAATPPATAAAPPTATEAPAVSSEARPATDGPGAPWHGIAGLDPVIGLHMVGGRASVYRRVLQRFVEHHGSDAARLRAAAGDASAQEVVRLCHSLKSVTGALGAQSLAAQATQIEGRLMGRAETGPALEAGSPAAAAAILALADTLETLLLALGAALASSPA
jgi:two-component system sensor histidine kinase/response regulator